MTEKELELLKRIRQSNEKDALLEKLKKFEA